MQCDLAPFDPNHRDRAGVQPSDRLRRGPALQSEGSLGLLGSLGFGTAASKTAAVVLDGFIEDDAKEMLAVVERVFGTLCAEYLLSKKEAESVVGDFQALDLPDTLRDMYAADDRRGYARGVLEPLVESRVRARMRVTLPSSEDLSKGTRRVLEELLGDAS